MDKYFARYPGVAQYMERTRAEARERGYVETVFGRRLWLPDITLGQPWRAARAPSAQAINAPMQGTAADLIKLAMIAVQGWIEIGEARHQARDAGARRAGARGARGRARAGESHSVEKLMTGVAKLDVPLVVDAGVGENWEKAH